VPVRLSRSERRLDGVVPPESTDDRAPPGAPRARESSTR
jgi:hypothetical protein